MIDGQSDCSIFENIYHLCIIKLTKQDKIIEFITPIMNTTKTKFMSQYCPSVLSFSYCLKTLKNRIIMIKNFIIQ